MALVPGGPDTELITGILNGDTANVTFGKWVWVAQTFTLDQLYNSWRFAAKIGFVNVVPVYLIYGIRTTAAGKPTGDDLRTTQLLHGPGRTTPGGLWWPQNFPYWPNLAAGTWAMVIRAPGATTPWIYYARAAPELPPGITGKCWKSTNSGVDWTEVEGYFLLHQVWGIPYEVTEPPPKVVSNWAPLDWVHNPIPDGFQVQVTTDIPVHLWMRYSLNPPLKHKVERFRRGLAMPWNTYYCFTAWKEIEQDEDGDTLVHTFTILDWPVCQTRWFYFTGTKRLYPTPSASPIFQLHRQEVTDIRYAFSRHFMSRGSLIYRAAATGIASTIQITATPTGSMQVYLFSKNNDSVVVQVALQAVDEDDKPTGPELASQLINLSAGELIQDYDEHQIVYKHTATLPYTYDPSTHYAIVVITLSGTANWWLSFRRWTWQGPRDEGEENHVAVHMTIDGGATWTLFYTQHHTYEAWGYQ